MRRALCQILIALFGLAPLAPLLSAEPASSLPACCRRAGNHHCSSPGTNGPAVHSNCAWFPGNAPVPGTVASAAAADAPAISAPAAFRLAVVPAALRTPTLRPRHTVRKRGPPSPFIAKRLKRERENIENVYT